MTIKSQLNVDLNLDHGTANPNAKVIAGLREIADLLEAHPELPQAYYSHVNLRMDGSTATPARETLTTLAAALGDRAREDRYGANVTIRGTFGAVDVLARATVSELTDTPPEPREYEPIIAAPDGES